jgi:transketolase
MCNKTTKEINKIKRDIVKVSFHSKEGHLGSSFSVLDILYILYGQIMKFSVMDVDDENRDYVILSKGHASLGHAAILKSRGVISDKQLASYCSHQSILGGHLNRLKVPGVEASTGSLGHGISISIGIALAMKIKQTTNRVFVIVGDGETNEGTFWESMLLGAHHSLNNLCCIIDYNRSNDRALKLDPLEDKIKAFGWDVTTIDGHSHDAIFSALNKYSSNKPKMIIANTIKGKGIKEMENNHAWHKRSPTKEELKRMIEELS